MIIIKGKQLVDLRIGNIPVTAWYRGDVQYWGGSQPQPVEYTELEWISSGDNNDWLAIDTGVLACNQYRMVADIQFNAHNTQVQRFGSQWCTGPGASGDYYTFAFGTTESGWSMNTGFASSGGKWEISSSRDTNRHVFDAMFYAPYTGKFDSTTHTFPNTGTAQPPSEENTLMLFARHRWTGYGVEIDNYCSCKLYSCKIYDAQGNLVRDFIPASIDGGDKVGMWDKVTNQFYWSTRESNFDPGPAKEATPITFLYVNGVSSSTTYYIYNGVLYIDPEMSQTAPSGTYVNASYRYTVSSDGSYTTESYSSYSSVTPSATLYVTSAKAYSNPGLTTYATAGTYVSATESLVVTSNGSYTRTPLSPYRYLDGAVFSGSQYIKTGIKLQRYDTVYYDFIPTSTTTSRYPLGVMDSTSSTSSNRFYMNVSSATNIQLYNVSRTASNISYSVNNALQGNISVGNRTFTYELYVGAMNSVGSATGAWSGVVKSFRIVRSNNDIINLVPVERLSDHKIGFYNSVDDTFVACTGGDPTEWTAPAEDIVELQYVTVPPLSQGDFLTQFDATGGQTYKIAFGYAPDSTAVGGTSAGFYLSSVDCPQGPGTNGGDYAIWGSGWGSASSSKSAVEGVKSNIEFTFNNSTGATMTIDGTSNSWGAGNFTFGNFGSFHIDGGSPSASVAGDCTLSGKWYTVKEYLSGTLQHDYIPAKTSDGSKVGFYDTVTKKWVLRSAGAAWVAGPAA